MISLFTCEPRTCASVNFNNTFPSMIAPLLKMLMFRMLAQMLKNLLGYHAGYIAKKSKQTIDLTCLRIDINVEVARCSRKARDGLDIGSQSISIVISEELCTILAGCYSQISCTNCQSNIPNRHRKTSRRSL